MSLIDATGKELKIGQSVYFTYYSNADLIRGKIVSIKPKTIIIKSMYAFPAIIRHSSVNTRVIIINN